MKYFSIVITIVMAVFLVNCKQTYKGEVIVTPEKFISVQDSKGKKLAGYDLYIYRCTNPGSQFDDVFLFRNETSDSFHLENQIKKQNKKIGGQWLAPDFYVSNEPQPYWVACVSKKGFADKRWGLDDLQGKNVTIKLKESSSRGKDICHTEKMECSACKSYDYFMYGPMRYEGCN